MGELCTITGLYDFLSKTDKITVYKLLMEDRVFVKIIHVCF